uniref:Uncharacterized protein n=1 Tax=Anguilla anguilla TaxID=7936 RepID=A0A0E9R1T0_ANGAN
MPTTSMRPSILKGTAFIFQWIATNLLQQKAISGVFS